MPYWVTVSWDIPLSRPEVNIVAGPYATFPEAAGVASQLLRQTLKQNPQERISYQAESEEQLQDKIRRGAHFGYRREQGVTYGQFPLPQ